MGKWEKPAIKYVEIILGVYIVICIYEYMKKQTA